MSIPTYYCLIRTFYRIFSNFSIFKCQLVTLTNFFLSYETKPCTFAFQKQPVAMLGCFRELRTLSSCRSSLACTIQSSWTRGLNWRDTDLSSNSLLSVFSQPPSGSTLYAGIFKERPGWSSSFCTGYRSGLIGGDPCTL